MSPGFKTALGYLSALAVLEALAIYVMENYERVRVPEWVGYAGEAHRNDYLAAQRFVVAMGREARGIETLYGESAMPPTEGTILVSGDRRLMSPAQHRRLLDWAQAGGDLIVTVGDDVSKDAVLKAIGVRLFEEAGYGLYLPNEYMTEPENWVTFDPTLDEAQADDSGATAAADENEDATADDDGADHVFAEDDEHEDLEVGEAAAPARDVDDAPRQLVHVPGSREIYNVSPSAHELVSENPGGWQVTGRTGAYAVREPHGAGTVTVLGSLWFIENQMIGEVDHAPFFWAILAANGHRGPVWFVFGDDAPSIWTSIAEHGWPALATLGLVVVLLLWRHMPRVGAPIAPLAPIRRELIEHVDATGRFLVDHGGDHVLTASVQKHVKRRLLMRYPQVAALPERERRGRLAQLAKLSPSEVDAIYRPQVGLSRNDFVAVQRVLERLSQNP
ncbi:MAG: DUF4350 domain-containing protein [Myxococcota bacterium]|nr:DUF4350 domain-containing protein [Myxococcota bacterium]